MILVTGGTGLVGAHILLELSINKINFIALKRQSSNMEVCQKIFSYYKVEELFNKIQWVVGDITNISSLNEVVEGCENIIHCAAVVSFHKSDIDLMRKVNIEGTANVMNVALSSGIKKCAYISSVATLSGNLKNIINEENYFKKETKNSNYSITKYYAEQEVWRASAEGLDVIIVNPSIILGPGNWDKGSSQIFKKIYTGLKFFSEGGSGYIDVIDVARATIDLLFSKIKNERFILSSENLSYKECFDKIALSLKKPPAKIKVTPFLKEFAWRLEFIKSLFSDEKPLITKETANNAMIFKKYSNKKVKKYIGYNFIPIEESIKKYSKWFISDF